jgi:3'(2'), 5'-bisphosphate nucleotidase/inositol polyphosphate 1-phosphatase
MMHKLQGICLQVVVGVLGCPNLPQKRMEDADGADESASMAGTDGVGVIFAAERGQGAFAGPLSGALPQA